MFRPFALVAFCLTLSVSACGRESPSTPATPATTLPSASAPAVAQTPESRQATATQESSGDTSPEDRSDAALERLAAIPANQQLPDGKWKVGVHYKPLMPPQPTDVTAGKVEVVEVFWFGCPHCSALEPTIESWEKNKAAYIEFVRVPVMWGPVHRAHARLFYTLQALGRADLTQKVFDTIHRDKNMLVANDETATRKLQVDFAKANGIDEKKFLDAYESFGVNSNLQRAEQRTARYQVTGVPDFIVNGKYKTDVGMAGNPSTLLAILDDLAASEKHH